MSMISYNIQIKTESVKDHDLLYQVLLQHQQIWNFISENTFATKDVNRKIIHDNNYTKCRELFPCAPAQIIVRAINSVYSTYKSIKSNKCLNNLRQFCKQSNLNLRLDYHLYKFLSNNQIEITTPIKRKRAIFSYDPYPKFKDLLNTYSMSDPLLYYKDNQFWLNVSFEVPEPTHIPNSVIGVDLGIKRLAVTSEGLALTDKDFLKQKRKIRFLKRILNSKKKKTNSHSAKTKLNKLRHKEHNKNNNLCHHLANKILETTSNTIVLEDLSSLKKKNLKKGNFKKSKSSKNKLSQVPFGMLKDILTYKALLRGKKVITVNPYMTSQKDHRGLPNGIRKGCRYYTSDKLIFDADWNAAINIAHKYMIYQDVKHPVSFILPLDGRLNYIGKLLSIS